MMENNTDISCEETLKHSSSLATQHRALEPHITDTFGCKQRPIGKWLRVGDLRRTLWLRRPTTAQQAKLLNHLNQSTKKMRHASSRSVFVWIDAIHVLLHSHGKCSSLECHKLVTECDKTWQNLRPLQKLQVTWSILVGHSTAFYSIVQHPKDVSLIPWYTMIYLDIPWYTLIAYTNIYQLSHVAASQPLLWNWTSVCKAADAHAVDPSLTRDQGVSLESGLTRCKRTRTSMVSFSWPKFKPWFPTRLSQLISIVLKSWSKLYSQRLRYCICISAYQRGFRCDLCDLWATKKGEKGLKNSTSGLLFSV